MASDRNARDIRDLWMYLAGAAAFNKETRDKLDQISPQAPPEDIANLIGGIIKGNAEQVKAFFTGHGCIFEEGMKTVDSSINAVVADWHTRLAKTVVGTLQFSGHFNAEFALKQIEDCAKILRDNGVKLPPVKEVADEEQ